MEPCWILTCSLIWKHPSQMADMIGARILPSIYLFLYFLSFEMVSIYAGVASGSVSSVSSQEYLLLCFPLLPPYQTQHNLVDWAFCKTFLDQFCPPWLLLRIISCVLHSSKKFFFFTKCSIILILFQQAGHKILRARPWNFRLFVLLGSSEKGLQKRSGARPKHLFWGQSLWRSDCYGLPAQK